MAFGCLFYSTEGKLKRHLVVMLCVVASVVLPTVLLYAFGGHLILSFTWNGADSSSESDIDQSEIGTQPDYEQELAPVGYKWDGNTLTFSSLTSIQMFVVLCAMFLLAILGAVLKFNQVVYGPNFRVPAETERYMSINTRKSWRTLQRNVGLFWWWQLTETLGVGLVMLGNICFICGCIGAVPLLSHYSSVPSMLYGVLAAAVGVLFGGLLYSEVQDELAQAQSISRQAVPTPEELLHASVQNAGRPVWSAQRE